MPGDDPWFDETDDAIENGSYPEDDSDDQQTETRPCPHCGAGIYEDAVRCPVCGTYVTADQSTWSNRPWWWIALGVLGVLAAIATLVRFGGW